MIKKDTFMYDEDLDRLIVFNNLKEDEKVYGSVNMLNLILDITNKNRIANIEIRNISDYLLSLDKNVELLKELTEVKINIQQVRGGFLMNILLITKNKIEKIPYPIATAKEVLITA